MFTESGVELGVLEFLTSFDHQLEGPKVKDGFRQFLDTSLGGVTIFTRLMTSFWDKQILR